MIILKFIDSRCRYDNLTLYNKIGNFADHTEHFIGLYCGDRSPSKMTFENSAMIIFSTDSSVTTDGFEIHYGLNGKHNKLFQFFHCFFLCLSKYYWEEKKMNSQCIISFSSNIWLIELLEKVWTKLLFQKCGEKLIILMISLLIAKSIDPSFYLKSEK